MPLISVITPASRGIKHLSNLFRDFKNQTLGNHFEHIVVFDGDVPKDVQLLADSYKNKYNLKFTSIKKDSGNMKIAPGTRPRNYGVSIASGDYVVFCDDDDRYKDVYLETLATDLRDNFINVVQMSCQESRMYRNGKPDRTLLVPEIGVHYFPIICHVGTPCFIVPKKWALEEPWRHEPEHDFRFIHRICEKYKPQIRILGGMLVDVDGIVTQGIRDWVSKPPFYRE